MNNKVLVISLIAVTSGVVFYTRPHNARPADLRDAVADSREFNTDIPAMQKNNGDAPLPQGAVPVSSTATQLSPELITFWEKLKKDTFDDICRKAELRLNQGAKLGNIAGVGGGFRRYMRKFPNEKVALIDEVDLKLSAVLSSEVLQLPDAGPLGISVTGLLEGKSQVIRPLDSDRYCRELDSLTKLYQIKTVLPARADRITAMKNGEIWKLPITLRYGFGAGVGGVTGEALNISISAGVSKERKPSVTLYRMDEGRLRLRLRLDRLEVRSVGISVGSVQIPMSDIGKAGAESVFAREVNRAWAREINKYLAFQLSYGRSRSFGKRLLLEFILDPRDPAQMEGLEKFLRGDFGIVKRFIEMGLRFNQFTEDDDVVNGLADISGASGQVGQGMQSDSSFAGSNLYSGHSESLHLQVPVVHARDTNWSASHNRYQSMAKPGEALHVQQQSYSSSGRSMNLPFAGTVMKYDSQKNVYVVNKERVGGEASKPALMYHQYEGFVKHGDASARYMVGKVNGVLRYVGVNGNGVNGEMLIPAGDIFPMPPQNEYGEDSLLNKPSTTYQTALMSFKLMINENGVQGILLAPAQAVMKACMNMMRETNATIIDKVMDLFRVGADGRVGYDQAAARKRLGVSPIEELESGSNPLSILNTLVYTATRVILDIASVRSAPGRKAQSDMLANVAGGNSKSGLKYEDFLKVVVQLAAPGNVSAQVYLHTDKRVKGEADITQTYDFFNGRDNRFDETLGEVNQMRERFTDPAELTD